MTDAPECVLSEPDGSEFEQIVFCRDRRAGLKSVVAIHDTSLGPAVGGIRMRSYPWHGAAVADALNLARAMTYKAALAGLSLGGGKSVINADYRAPNRDEILIAHARYVASLGGRYVPAIDMGTTVRDLELIGHFVPRVAGRRGDPSYFTARGVVRSIEVALTHATGRDLEAHRVAIQGLGSVGTHVARMLAELGVDVVGADIDDDKVASAVEQIGIEAAPLAELFQADVDLVAPCAAGGVIDLPTLRSMTAKAVVGAANNILTSRSVAEAMAGSGITYVPDFAANAGGLMAVEAELRNDATELEAKVDAIAVTVSSVLERAASTGLDSVSVALGMARERIKARRGNEPFFLS